jgi:protein Tex
MAKEKGLEPLAKLIWEQKIQKGNPLDYAREYVMMRKNCPMPTLY